MPRASSPVLPLWKNVTLSQEGHGDEDLDPASTDAGEQDVPGLGTLALLVGLGAVAATAGARRWRA